MKERIQSDIKEALKAGEEIKVGTLRMVLAFLINKEKEKGKEVSDEEVMDVYGNIIVLNKPFMVPDLCIGCGICETECPIKDERAVYVTAVGESRSNERKMLLRNREYA